VAGLVETPDGGRALVEDGSGKQRWYSPGDSLGDAEIVEIGEGGVTIRVDGELRFLSLRSGLAELGGLPGRTAPAAAAPPPSYETRQLGGRYLASRLNSYPVQRLQTKDQAAESVLVDTLELPAGARVTAVDRKPVASASEAASEISRALESSNTVRLTISGAGPVDTIYVVAND